MVKIAARNLLAVLLMCCLAGLVPAQNTSEKVKTNIKALDMENPPTKVDVLAGKSLALKPTPTPEEPEPAEIFKPGHSEATIKLSHPGLESFAIRGEGFLVPAVSIHAGQSFKYVVQISWEGKLGDIEVDEPDPPFLTNIRLLKVVPSNKVSPENKRAIAEFAYHLKGLDKGKAYIGMVDAKYRMKDGTGNGSFRLKELRFDLMASQLNWGKIILTALAAAGCLAALAVIYFGIRIIMRRKPTIQPAASDEISSAHERIRGELASMRLFLIDGEVRSFYDKMTKLAKGFIAATEGNEVFKMSTDEMLAYLTDKNYNPENRDRIFQILELCDRVKFAGHMPTQSESDQIIKEFETLLKAPH